MKKIELWLYAHLPFVFADWISFALHGLLTALPGLLGVWLGGGWQIAGACGSGFLAGWYWHREDGDVEKARALANTRKRELKLLDSARDRWTPVAVAFFFMLFAALRFGA